MGSVLPELTRALIAGRELTAEEVAAAAEGLFFKDVAEHESRKAFLRAWADKGETAAELATFARSLPRQVEIPGLPEAASLLDCCGTGGGGLPLFNVSTAMVFVLAALGVPVVKHGNRGVTKPSGSSDVIEALGLGALRSLPPERVAETLARLGFGYLHAPMYHPAFATLSTLRQELAAEGRRTIFNLLGPLANPARPGCRLVGVFREEHVPLYAEALRLAGCPRYAVVRGCVGGVAIGEASPTGENALAVSMGFEPGKIDDYFFQFEEAGAEALNPFLVADAGESAALIERLLTPAKAKEMGLARSLVAVNAGLALALVGKAKTAREGQNLARQAIDGGAAWERLRVAREFCT